MAAHSDGESRIDMKEPQDVAGSGQRRRATIGNLRGWRAYGAAVALSVLGLPVVLVMTAVHVVAGPRLAGRLHDAVGRRLGVAASPGPAPETLSRRSTFEKLYEVARVFVLVAAAAWLVQRWQGWPVFDYVSVAAVGVVSGAGSWFLIGWAQSRRAASGAAAS